MRYRASTRYEGNTNLQDLSQSDFGIIVGHRETIIAAYAAQNREHSGEGYNLFTQVERLAVHHAPVLFLIIR
ncbi:hypothetical protein WG66_005990 [Moniliophthora roreri]|nr:hypothetical protein WG66_005990 [Moniliophthora roreri]